MPMYDTNYIPPPTPHQILCKEQQDLYAKYIKENHLFEDLERLEEEHAQAVEQLKFLRDNNYISADEAHATEEYLYQSEREIADARLVIEQLDRASKGEAYGEGLNPRRETI